jgi:flavin reductase (DIM6/NTAB) family NADH-FMN oxidoreductase RutF
MLLDPRELAPAALYRLMTGVVVPRPIAFVSTVGAGGRFNVAPFSYFNAITNRPPLIGFSVGPRDGAPKDTLRNLRESRDFVVNVVSEPLLARAVKAAGDWPEDVSEFEITGLTAVPSMRVTSPRVGESPVSLECRLEREIALGEAVFVVGEIVCVHVDENVLTEGQVDIAKLKPAGRLGGDGYSIVRDVVHLPRPRVERAAGRGGTKGAGA